MTKAIAAGLVAALMLPVPARPDDHLVGNATVQARLAEAVAERRRNIAVVESFLSEPLVRQTGATLVLSVDELRRRVPALTDGELRDLAARVEALEADPASGMSKSAKKILIVVGALVVGVVLYFIWLENELEKSG